MIDALPSFFWSFDRADIAALAAGLAAFATVFAIWQALLPEGSYADRLAEFVRRREELRAGMAAPRRRTPLLADRARLMERIVRQFNLLRSREAEKMRLCLAQAGWRSEHALVRYLFMRLLLPALVGGFVILTLFTAGHYESTVTTRLLVATVLILAAAYAPSVFVRNQITKRWQKIRKALPDSLDLMVICAEAGLSLDATFTRVAREMRQASPEMAEELDVTAIELGFLPQRRMALDNLGRRVDLPEVRSLTNALLQTEKYGTPLARALRVLAAEYRDQRLLRAEEKAARLPATLTVPMIIFILPSLFVVLIGPAVLRTIDALRNL
jgi:tight adherence protein C